MKRNFGKIFLPMLFCMLTLTIVFSNSPKVYADLAVDTIVDGLNSPSGVAVDGTGNVYIADSGNNAVKKWDKATQSLSILVDSGMSNPSGVAVDSAGNVYIAATGNSAVKKWDKATQSLTTMVSSGLNRPAGVAVDGTGNVYIADSANGAIKKWDKASQSVNIIVSHLANPYGVALDSIGNVYIADTFSNTVKKWDKATQKLTTIVDSGLRYPRGVAVDSTGNVYIADYGNNAVKRWDKATGSVTTIVNSGLCNPYGVAVDSIGNVYISDAANNALKKFTTAAMPIANSAGGAVLSGTQVSLSSATSGAEIYYTLDGSIPTTSSAIHYTGAITVSSTETIKAIAVKTGMADSSVMSESYTVNTAPVSAANITAANVTGVTAPAAGAAPIALSDLTAGAGTYTVSGLAWQNSDGTPATMTSGGKFKAGSTYKAVVELTAAAGNKFQAGGFTPTANEGMPGAGTVSGGDVEGNKLTFIISFNDTAAQTVNNIAVQNQPAKLSYTAGEALDLTGLAARVTYNDGTTEDVNLTNFVSKGITTSPVNGTTMTVAAHNGQGISLTCNGHTATTKIVSVERIVTLAGSLQSELGCSGDWKADGEQSKMSYQGDGIYRLYTNALPAGSYEYKVAINGSWDENYGENGAAGGNNMTLSVPSNGSEVIFYYSDISHIITAVIANPKLTGTGIPDTELNSYDLIGGYKAELNLNEGTYNLSINNGGSIIPVNTITIEPNAPQEAIIKYNVLTGKAAVELEPIPIAPAPTFNPASGAIAFGTELQITSIGADHIYYTTNGDNPGTAVGGTTLEYNDASRPTINSGVTVKAIATKAGIENSTIVSASYTQAATADLTGLELSGTPGNYSFAGGTYSYNGVKVGNGVSSIIVTPTGAGTITVDGTTVASGTTSGAIALTVGVEKTITVVVTETGKSAKTYVIKVNRADIPPYTPPYNPPTPTPQPTTETREIPVVVDNGGIQTNAVQVPVTRTTDSAGKKTDTVKFDEEKAKETVTKALETKTDTATISVTDIPGNNADKVEVQVPQSSMTQLGSNNIGLDVKTEKAALELPKETVSGLKDKDVKIQISEVKDSSKVEEAKGLILKLASGSEVIAAPLKIETNFTGRTKITLPIDASKLPSSKGELDKFLSSLAVMVQHSDGENAVDKGTIVYDENGKPIGISIWVDKFSDFTLVSLPESYFQGRTTVMKDKVAADKEWNIKFTKIADSSTITKDNVYVTDLKGNKVEVEVSYDSDNILKVTPVNPYKSGETYYLYISKNVKAKDKTSLVNELRYQFTIK